MRRKDPRTETQTCDVLPAVDELVSRETDFEKRRGVSELEVREGFVQVHVSDLEGAIMPERLRVLKALVEADVSIDFLKLTPTGLSFIVLTHAEPRLREALSRLDVLYSITGDRCIVIVHAVSIRDEEGMIAEIVKGAIGSGAQIDHIGDGHDRLLLVVSSENARKLVKLFQVSLVDERTPVRRTALGA